MHICKHFICHFDVVDNFVEFLLNFLLLSQVFAAIQRNYKVQTVFVEQNLGLFINNLFRTVLFFITKTIKLG